MSLNREIENGLGLKIVKDNNDILDTFNDFDGFIYFGDFDIESLPEQDLYNFAMEQNQRTLRLLKRHDEIFSKYKFSDKGVFGLAISRFLLKLKLPVLADNIDKKKGIILNHPYRRDTALYYGFKDRKDYIIEMTAESVGTALLIPPLDIYIKFIKDEREAKKDISPDLTLDKAGWKNFIFRYKFPFEHFFFIPLKFYVPLEPFKRHCYITGGSGSGKSELIKLLVHNQLKSNKTSALVIDPHGDLVQEISKFRECNNNQRVIYFDPQLYTDKTPCIDIFSPPDTKNITIDTMAQNICDAFSEIIADSSISSQMRTLLIPCVSVLLLRPNSSLADLQRFMLNEENEDLLELGKNLKNAGQANFFKQGFNQKTYDLTKKSIYTRLQTLLNSTVFRRMINPKTKIDLEKELNNGSILLFNLSKTTLGDEVSSAFGRLLVAQIKSIGFRRQLQTKSKRMSSFIYIDECQNYIGESIETTLTELRKYGIHLILASQVVGQNMSSQLTNIVLSNTAVKLIGYNGEKTLRILSKETGASLEELQKLTVGKFFCKLNLPHKHTTAFSFKAPSFLVGLKHSMDFDDWKNQKRKGYVKNSLLDSVEEAQDIKGTGESEGYTEQTSSNKQDNKPKFSL